MFIYIELMIIIYSRIYKLDRMVSDLLTWKETYPAEHFLSNENLVPEFVTLLVLLSSERIQYLWNATF